MPDDQPTILAFDSGSRSLTVAVTTAAGSLGASEPQSRSSTQLPRIATDLLSQFDLTWRDLDAVVAARGPGSFTGLRVGLAFALGLHQALDIPAAGISTLRLLAVASGLDGTLTVAVNAWRDSWFIQSFDAHGTASTEPERIATAALADLDGPVVVSESVSELPAGKVASTSIAHAALDLATRADFAWDPTTLQRPLYLAPPPAILPHPTANEPEDAGVRT